MIRWLLTALIGLGFAYAHAQPPARAERPMFKGVELYSWQDRPNEGWRFALLPGTNRTKFLDEIRGGQDTFDSVQSLKNALSLLAPGEYVSWNHVDSMPFPPDMAADIETHAKALGIHLTSSWERSESRP